MKRLPIGVQVRSLRVPLRRGLQLAHEFKADSVEFDARHDLRPAELTPTALRQIRKWLDDFGLTVSSVVFQTRRGYHVQEDLEARVAATKAAMDMAYRLGARFVVNRIGPLPPATEEAEWNLLGAVLHDLARHANQAGAWLAVRIGDDDLDSMVQLQGLLPSGGVLFSLDPAELVIRRKRPADYIEKLGTSIAHVYAKDGVRDATAGKGLEAPLGRGSVDFPQLLGMLEERDYRGPLVLERTECDDPVYEIGQGVKFLRNLE